jgi:methionyl-tRNA synthetase
MVLTDIVKRWHVLKGSQAIMCTGTDEHGLKASTQGQSLSHMLTIQVQKAAAKAGVDPKAFCDKGADIFRVRPRS